MATFYNNARRILEANSQVSPSLPSLDFLSYFLYGVTSNLVAGLISGSIIPPTR